MMLQCKCGCSYSNRLMVTEKLKLNCTNFLAINKPAFAIGLSLTQGGEMQPWRQEEGYPEDTACLQDKL